MTVLISCVSPVCKYIVLKNGCLYRSVFIKVNECLCMWSALYYYLKWTVPLQKFFRRKTAHDLLPVKPVEIAIEAWWVVQAGYITEDDIKVLQHGLHLWIWIILIVPEGIFHVKYTKIMFQICSNSLMSILEIGTNANCDVFFDMFCPLSPLYFLH